MKIIKIYFVSQKNLNPPDPYLLRNRKQNSSIYLNQIVKFKKKKERCETDKEREMKGDFKERAFPGNYNDSVGSFPAEPSPYLTNN